MKYRKIFALLLAAATLFSLAACGETAAGPEATPDPALDESAATVSGQTLTFAGAADDVFSALGFTRDRSYKSAYDSVLLYRSTDAQALLDSLAQLRPGEKLYEELLMDSEQDKMAKTAHNKIFIAPPIQIDLEKFYTDLQRLKESARHNSDEVVDVLQEMVPTYHPNRRVRADHTVVAASGNTMILSREELDKARKLHDAKGE